MAGNTQRTTLSIILSHSCGTFRVFFATPANNEPGGERLNQSIEEGAVSQNLDTSTVQRRKLLIWGQFSLLRNNINAKGLQ